jgi:hypothetical protein
MSVLVLLPTRERPELAARCVESVFETARDPETAVALYVDHDCFADYAPHFEKYDPSVVSLSNRMNRTEVRSGIGRVLLISGPRVGPVASTHTMINMGIEQFDVYGMANDDCTFVSPGWDSYLLDAVKTKPGRMAIVSAAHDKGDQVNFPWMTRELYSTLGWYYWTGNFHYCVDTILELIGEATNTLVYAPRDKFLIYHDILADEDKFNNARVQADLLGFLMWCVIERKHYVQLVREQVEEAIERGI